MEATEGPIHLCYDRTLPLALVEEAKRIAVQENPADEVDPKLDVNDPNLAPPERVALIAQKRRRPGKLPKIRFLDASPRRGPGLYNPPFRGPS